MLKLNLNICTYLKVDVSLYGHTLTLLLVVENKALNVCLVHKIGIYITS